MIPIPSGTQIWVACGATDMRRGFDGLAMMVQDVLKRQCGRSGRYEWPQSPVGRRKPPRIPTAEAGTLPHPRCAKCQRPAREGDRRARQRGWECNLLSLSARRPGRFAQRALFWKRAPLLRTVGTVVLLLEPHQTPVAILWQFSVRLPPLKWPKRYEPVVRELCQPYLSGGTVGAPFSRLHPSPNFT